MLYSPYVQCSMYIHCIQNGLGNFQEKLQPKLRKAGWVKYRILQRPEGVQKSAWIAQWEARVHRTIAWGICGTTRQRENQTEY